MCGIAGFYGFKGFKFNLLDLKEFASPLNHRGPDGEGFEMYSEQRVGLAHKRLSILDISIAGKQPMQYANNRFSISFNGEIYNFLELRNILVSKQYQFNTNTDTEVILAAYDYWGINCFNKFNGMWAIAIYDDNDKTILLSRDRFGIKPLYYKHYGSFFAFASETNCFAKLKDHPRSFNHDVLMKSLINPNYAASINSSIFDGIEQVPPATIIKIDASGVCQKQQYYNFNKACAEKSDIEFHEGDFFNLFEDAVKLRLRSDVPIATAFSGGLDSTAVFSMVHHIAKNQLAQRLPESWQKAFCMEFNGSENNDGPYARAALQEMGWNAEFIEVAEEDIFDKIRLETTYFDDIIGAPLSSITGIYASMKANGYSVSLDGHGADEYLFGYRNMVNDVFYNSLQLNGKKTTLQIGVALLNMYHPEQRKEVKKRLNTLIKAAYKTRNYFKRIIKNTLQTNDFDKELTYQNFLVDPLPGLLKNFDKASMYSGVEVRMPFMDYRLVEMCQNLPLEMKINKGHTKWIVKDELKSIMPRVTLERTYKIGIGAPINQWLANKSKYDEILQEGPHKHLIPKEILANTNEDKSELWKYLNLQLIKL